MKEFKYNEKFYFELLAKYLTGETGNDEIELVEAWLRKKENNHEFETSQRLLEKVEIYYKTRHFDKISAWQYVRSRINKKTAIAEVQGKKRRNTAIVSLLKYAAILILVTLTGTMAYYLTLKSKSHEMIEIQASDLVLREQFLPDGTRVALNSNSALCFPREFNATSREVSIEGEAFFEVTPDSTRPFIITAGLARIQVLGTSFNVNAYPDMELVEVIVTTGKVQLAWDSEKANTPLVLIAGDKGSFMARERQLVKVTNTDLNYLAWKTRDLIFNESPLEEVIKNLEKIYQIEIQTNDPAINSMALTARFNDQPVDYVLEVIRQTFNLQLDFTNGHYLFSYSIQ